MKILIEHTFHNPYNPERVTGGVERYCHQLWSLLRENEHDAVLAVPKDTDPRYVDGETVVYIDRLSKQATKNIGKVASHKVWWKAIEKLSSDFDKVITNSELSSLAFMECEELASKVVHINHFPFLATGCQMAFRYLLCCHFIRNKGGLVLSSGELTRQKAEKTWTDKRGIIAEHYPDAFSRITEDGPTHAGDIDVNILPSDLEPTAKTNGKRVIAVGRPEPGKKLVLAANTLVSLAERGWECECYLTPYGKDFQKVMSILEDTQVTVHVKAPHAEIMKAFAAADYLLFTSTDETNGMTAFEAAASGCTVLYQTPEPKHFLEPSGAGVWFKDEWKSLETEDLPVCQSRASVTNFFASNYSDEAVSQRIMRWLLEAS